MEVIMHSLLSGDIWGPESGHAPGPFGRKISFPNGPGVTPAAGWSHDRENRLAAFGLADLLGYVPGRHVGLQEGLAAGKAQVEL
jgi:hypothetical protein